MMGKYQENQNVLKMAKFAINIGEFGKILE